MGRKNWQKVYQEICATTATPKTISDIRESVDSVREYVKKVSKWELPAYSVASVILRRLDRELGCVFKDGDEGGSWRNGNCARDIYEEEPHTFI